MIDRIVLNIPHSSAEFPTGAKARWEGDVDAQIQRWTDWYIGHIFCTAALKDPRIRPVVFPWSRFFCDVERPELDPLEKKSLGLAYTRFEDCVRRLSVLEKEQIYRDYYLEHMAAVMNELTPTSILINCHSFPSDLSDAEVCIGINSNWSVPDKMLLTSIRHHFERRGYKTEFNDPYSYSYAPEMYFPYPSLMIGFNRSTYMTPDGELDHTKAELLRLSIEQLYDRILSPWVHGIYKTHFRLLYENREQILRNARMSSATVGMAVFGTDITLGIMLSAIEDNPEVFCRKDSIIFTFNGNPLSGTASNTMMNMKTGKVSTYLDSNLKAMREAIVRAAQKITAIKGSLPLSTVVEMLEKQGA